MKYFTHNTAEVSASATIGEGTKIWNNAQIREGVQIGKNCVIAKGVYIDIGVKIGDNVKIENMASVYQGSEIENGVFVGPHVCLTNDKTPRAVNPHGKLKSGGTGTTGDWTRGNILVKEGASIGAGAMILPDVIIGSWAMVGAGSVVTKNVPDYGLVLGNPASLVGFVCKCGIRLKPGNLVKCVKCGKTIRIKGL